MQQFSAQGRTSISNSEKGDRSVAWHSEKIPVADVHGDIAFSNVPSTLRLHRQQLARRNVRSNSDVHLSSVVGRVCVQRVLDRHAHCVVACLCVQVRELH